MRILIIFLLLGLSGVYLFQAELSSSSSKNFSRVVALSPAHSQLFKYVNLVDKLIAVSIYDQEPLVQDKHKINGGVIVEEEELLKLNPDLVLIGDIKGSGELISFLKSKKVAYEILPTKSLQDIGDSLNSIQRLFPKDIDKKTITQFHKSLSDIQISTPKNRRKALIIISIDPVYSLSTNDYLSEVYQYSGWDSVIHSQISYPILDEEDLFSLDNVDDILITPHLSNEVAYISNIYQKIQAKNIIIITNHNIELPSPYLIDTIKELRIQQSSLLN